MDVEREIIRMQAENMALQAVVVGMCRWLSETGNRAAIEQVFSFADAVSEASATSASDRLQAVHAVDCAEVLEQLRAAAMPRP